MMILGAENPREMMPADVKETRTGLLVIQSEAADDPKCPDGEFREKARTHNRESLQKMLGAEQQTNNLPRISRRVA